MQIHFDEGATEKIQPHLGDDKKLLLTFEDGVGPYLAACDDPYAGPVLT